MVEQWGTQFGPRIEQFDYNDYQLTAGLKGAIGSTSLRWNVFGSYGQTNFNNYESNTINLAHVTYKINHDVQAYGQINFMHSTAQDLQGGAFFNGNPKPLLVPLNNPFVQNNPSLQTLIGAQTTPSNGPLVVEQWATQFGPRVEQFDYNDYQLTAGLKGAVGTTSVRWNVFGSYGQTNFNNYETNTINLPALETIMYGTANYLGGSGNACVGYALDPLGNHPLSKGCL